MRVHTGVFTKCPRKADSLELIFVLNHRELRQYRAVCHGELALARAAVHYNCKIAPNELEFSLVEPLNADE